MPKFIINGNNDPYWTVDALNLYWNDLKGDKYVVYVPNAGHNLQQKLDSGGTDRSRAINSLAAFGRHQIRDKPLPKVTWKHDDDAGKLRLTVAASPAPSGARLWMADSTTQDFRKAKWSEEKIATEKGGAIVGQVSPPSEGYRAFYAELDYDVDGLAYHLSTQIRVSGK